MTRPPVTVDMLIYRSPEWMNFALDGLIYARNRTPTRVMVVGNDANEEVMDTGRVDVDFFSNPDEPTGTYYEPSVALRADKEHFGSSRRARWFGL